MLSLVFDIIGSSKITIDVANCTLSVEELTRIAQDMNKSMDSVKPGRNPLFKPTITCPPEKEKNSGEGKI